MEGVHFQLPEHTMCNQCVGAKGRQWWGREIRAVSEWERELRVASEWERELRVVSEWERELRVVSEWGREFSEGGS